MDTAPLLKKSNGGTGEKTAAGFSDKSWFGWRYDDADKTCSDSAWYMRDANNKGPRYKGLFAMS